MATITELHVNGTKHRIDADPARSLLSVLRDDLDLTGSKYGCGEGRCGACTVAIDGKATRSCTTLVGDCAGKKVTTIEGLERDGKLHPLQEAFLEDGAMHFFFFSSRRRHTRFDCDWSSDVCSSDLVDLTIEAGAGIGGESPPLLEGALPGFATR